MNLNTHIEYLAAQPEILYIPAVRYMWKLDLILYIYQFN